MKTVVGALLNFRGAWQAMEPAMHQPPHHRPPLHPVLYLKPANTWAADGDPIVLPDGIDEIEVGATVGLVIGRTASRLREAEAMDFVAGYRVVNDVTVPHAAILRPPLKQKCRDGFCPMGPVVPATAVEAAAALTLQASVNDHDGAVHALPELIRGIAQLLAEVTEFMTLEPDDLLLIGVPENMPRARAGDRVAVEVAGLGRIVNPVVRAS